MTDPRAWVAVALVAGLMGTVAGVRWLAGPVFAHELSVLARRGYQPRLRAGLVGVLLVALLIGYVAEFGWDAVGGRTPTVDPRSGRFAETFAVTTLAVQLLAVMVLAPAVVGAAITEERDRGTLDLLRTSDLTDREIVVGKLLARLAVVGGVAAAGLPVLALTLLFGGVSPNLLLTVYGITTLAAFGLGAVSIYLGTVKDSLRSVLTMVYGGVLVATVAGVLTAHIPGVGGLSPAALSLWELLRPVWPFNLSRGAQYWWVSYVVFGLLYGVGGVWAVWLAVGRVRTSTVRRTDDPAAARAVRRGYYARPLTDQENPLVWQERVFGGRRFGNGEVQAGCCATVLFLIGWALFAGVAVSIERWEWIGGAVGRAVRPLLIAASVVLPLALGLRLAGVIAGERERQTLDALLMLPGDRRGVLRAKLVAAVGWAGWGIGLVAVSLLLAVVVGGIGIPAGLLSAIQLTAATTAAIGLAGWLSVRELTGARATVLFLVAFLAANIGPLLLAPAADLFGPVAGAAVRTVSPPAAAWAVGQGAGWQAVAALVSAIGYAAVGVLLWAAAEWRLEAGRG